MEAACAARSADVVSAMSAKRMAPLKRKNVAKVKVVGDLAVTGHLSLMGIMAFGPRMALI
jgi:hypothetical protein